MLNPFNVYGHAYLRKFYCFPKDKNTKREEHELPGGAALIAKLLGNH